MKKTLVSSGFGVLLILFLPMTASANSSWHWFTDKPYTMLPWSIFGTLAIEIFIVSHYNKIHNHLFTSAVVAIANLISFLLPYAFLGVPEANVPYEGPIQSILYTVSKMPIYTVNIGFLLLTLAVEVPIVYAFLRKKVQGRKRLSITIIIANTLTTAAIAAIERFFFRGSW